MYSSIGKLFDLAAEKNRDKEALADVSRGVRRTFKEWQGEVNQCANALLDAGVRKGDRVSTFLFNCAELATVFFACAKIGAVLNPVNFRLKAKEAAFILNDCSPKLVLFEKALQPEIDALHEEFPRVQFWSIDSEPPSYAGSYQEKIKAASDSPVEMEISENDLYAIMYTSGTTGRPKGVLHRHRDMIDQAMVCSIALRLTPNDCGLVAAPMFHCAELHCCLLPRVLLGAKNVILHHFDPKLVLQTIKEEKVTLMFGAPTMWNMLLQEDLQTADFSSMRIGLYGAAPMAPVLVKQLKEQAGIELIQAYGMTEMGPAVTFLAEDEQLSKAGSAGRVCFGHELIIARPREDGPADPDDRLEPYEVGEILVKGPSVMAGYYKRPEASEKALYKGWYHSGDLGYLDRDGYLFVADRVDDMIISGGENVYPREVEDALHAHSGVLDAAVLGEPDEKWGEKVVAYIVKKDPSVTEDELEQFCKTGSSLADYKRPRKYIFTDQLPRNASGKIQKFLLREQLAKQLNS
ncbi:long-chain-fatty-acid--CoA ligase [Bacillus mangrovi]|uniref:Long-chain-fatty-acid--CoA ligase n=1 Tax=Metabacillus mangrovi TaxID=1491830 RepID=A0A7X2S798_9BACI|nr:fatty acid--CoA ligase [Metabacillus mangrovi]MTH54595.1 long-chain-fatty-acid--CoA ligase [Metabacillus mangrovi]